MNKANINGLVKRFVNFTFKSLKKTRINLDDFQKWIKKYPLLINVFSDTFHEDYWAVDAKSSIPFFIKK